MYIVGDGQEKEIKIWAATCQERKVWLMGKYFIFQMWGIWTEAAAVSQRAALYGITAIWVCGLGFRRNKGLLSFWVSELSLKWQDTFWPWLWSWDEGRGLLPREPDHRVVILHLWALLVSGSWLHCRRWEVGSVKDSRGKSNTRCLRPPSSKGYSSNLLYNLSLSHWTRDGPERNSGLTQKTTEVFKNLNRFSGHRRINETLSDLAMCWLLGIPHCKEVHPLPERYSGGISLETHSAIGHLYHWAVQRKRQGELFSVHYFALQVKVGPCFLNSYFSLLLFLHERESKRDKEEEIKWPLLWIWVDSWHPFLCASEQDGHTLFGLMM